VTRPDFAIHPALMLLFKQFEEIQRFSKEILRFLLELAAPNKE